MQERPRCHDFPKTPFLAKRTRIENSRRQSQPNSTVQVTNTSTLMQFGLVSQKHMFLRTLSPSVTPPKIVGCDACRIGIAPRSTSATADALCQRTCPHYTIIVNRCQAPPFGGSGSRPPPHDQHLAIGNQCRCMIYFNHIATLISIYFAYRLPLFLPYGVFAAMIPLSATSGRHRRGNS
jgi:hypothetical protein